MVVVVKVIVVVVVLAKVSYFFFLEKIPEPLTHSLVLLGNADFFFPVLIHSFWWTAVFFFPSVFFFRHIFFVTMNNFKNVWNCTPRFFSNWPPAPLRIKNKRRNLQKCSWYFVLFQMIQKSCSGANSLGFKKVLGGGNHNCTKRGSTFILPK